MTVVKGHGLQREGRPYWKDDCRECLPGEHRIREVSGEYLVYYSRSGHPLCACGWMGLHDTSNRGRQTQHRAHKQDILDMQGDS
jgi:hypothetical protein